MNEFDFEREQQWRQEIQQARHNALLKSQDCIDCKHSRVVSRLCVSEKTAKLNLPPFCVCLLDETEAYVISFDDTAYSTECDHWEYND